MKASVLACADSDFIAQQQMTPEDLQRAQFYGLLSRLLAQPLNDEALAGLTQLASAGGTPLGDALADLGQAATGADCATLDNEFHDLFIGLGRGELLPFACHYLTGFLQDVPLARLRTDMAKLDIALAEGRAEPEDHIASLCEMMAGLILGSYGAAASLAIQQTFFDTHLRPWAPQFFADLETAGTATFYRAVGTLGRVFIDVETNAFALAD